MLALNAANVVILICCSLRMQVLTYYRFESQRWYQMLPFCILFQYKSKLAQKLTFILLNQNQASSTNSYTQIQRLSLQQFLFIILQFQIVLLAVAKIIIGKQNRLLTLIIANLLLFMLSISPALSLHTQLFIDTPILVSLLVLALIGFIVISIFDKVLKNYRFSFSLRRKIFHFVPVFIIVIMENLYLLFGYSNKPQISKFISIMLAGNFYIMIMLQWVRYFIKDNKKTKSQQALSKYGQKLSNFVSDSLNFILNPLFSWMQQFNQDNRQKHLLLTHLYLYLGLIIGHDYLVSEWSNVSVINVSCIMMLADAMAAIFGKRHGKTKVKIVFLKIKTNKTYLGSFAFFITTFTIMLTFWSKQIVLLDFIQICLICFACTLAELFSGDLDNVITIIVFIVMECGYQILINWNR